MDDGLAGLLLLSDSALPIGGFARSGGYEVARAIGIVRDRRTLRDFMLDVGANAASVHGAAIRLVFERWLVAADKQAVVAEAQRRLSNALRLNEAEWAASAAQGEALLTLLAEPPQAAKPPKTLPAVKPGKERGVSPGVEPAEMPGQILPGNKSDIEPGVEPGENRGKVLPGFEPGKEPAKILLGKTLPGKVLPEKILPGNQPNVSASAAEILRAWHANYSGETTACGGFSDDPPHFAVVFAVACLRFNVRDSNQAVLSFLVMAMRGTASAAVRDGLLGPTSAQALLFESVPLARAAAAGLRSLEPRITRPALDVVQSAHKQLRCKFFLS